MNEEKEAIAALMGELGNGVDEVLWPPGMDYRKAAALLIRQLREEINQLKERITGEQQ
jgi:hypothetical protein